MMIVCPAVGVNELHFWRGRIVEWRHADRSSVGLLPPARAQTEAVVRVFSAHHGE
jgi:hypothetical protein